MKKSLASAERFGGLKVLLALWLAVLGFATGRAFSARSAGPVWAENIPAQQVIENDLFLYGESPTIEGTVKGNVFALGRAVQLDGDVEGSVFVVSDRVSLNGRVSGSVYAVGLTIRQNAGSEIGQSLFAGAVNLVTERGAAIGRDLQTVAVSANLRGSVGRYTQAKIGLLELFRVLQRGITGGITGLPLPWNGAGAFQAARWVGYGFAGLLPVMMERSLAIAASSPAQQAGLPAPWLDALKALLVLIVIGVAALWLFPRPYERMVEQARQRPLASLGVGAIVLVNGFLMPVLLTVMVGSAFFGLFFLSVPDLAWMVFGIGFGVSVTAFSLFLIATSYLSKAVVASVVGSLLLSRLPPRYTRFRALPLVLGLAIYVALVSIPYLGFTIGLAVTMIGLGAMWLARKPAPRQPTLAEDAPPASTGEISPASVNAS